MKQSQKTLSLSVVMFILAALLLYPSFSGMAQTDLPESPQAEIKTYIPLVSKAVQSSTDLSISSIEVTQAVQGSLNHVQLVNGRPTTVRVYARVNLASPLANVRVALYGTRDGAPLPGSPLISEPKYAQPLTTTLTTLRLDINKSFNFSLPAEWLGGQVNLEARVDVSNNYFESNESNNSFTYTTQFLAIPALTVKIVPIIYYSTYEYKTYSLSSTVLEQNRQKIQQALMKIYPVGMANVVVRTSALNFSGDLYEPFYWDSLLDKLAILKSSDGSPASEVYYGLIPILDSSGNSWWYGGILGYGYVGPPAYSGPRAAIGLASGFIKLLNYTVEGEVTAAHEIGHNLGRLHAPCGNPADTDPSYPYSGGVIGQFGLDTSSLQIYAPSTNYDIMGYCDNVWVSDYNYAAMMQSQISYGASQTTNNILQESLLLNAQIDGQGMIEVQPSFILPSHPAEESASSNLQAQFLDAQGLVLASYPVPISLALAKEFSTFHINTALPIPDQKPASIRILRDGAPIYEKTIAQDPMQLTPNADRPQIIAQASGNSLSLKWGLAGVPVILRYSIDGGETWTTLDLANTAGEWTGSIAEFAQNVVQFQVIPAWSLEMLTLNWSAAMNE